jgi:aminoglycoside 6'-N-acetyltransferase
MRRSAPGGLPSKPSRAPLATARCAAVDLAFRPLERGDFGLLSRWLAAPHVEPWWREDSDPGAVEARYGPAVDRKDPTEVFVVEADGTPVGMIQRYLMRDNPEWERAVCACVEAANAAGIDYLIGDPALIGHGLGGQMIQRFVKDTWERHPEVAVVIVDVDQANRRSWRALETAGFSRQWAGILDSDDPSDQGPAYLYVLRRQPPSDRSEATS